MDSTKTVCVNIIFHSLIALICISFCSNPFWFPHLCSFVSHLVSVSLPNLKSFFFNPKCLFFVGNAIVVFLVRESKLASSRSSPASDIYDDSVERNRKICETHENEGKLRMDFSEEGVIKIEDKCMVVREKEDKSRKEEEVVEAEEEEEEEPGLPKEELKKRVEDFIARVNRQRWLEARLEDFGRG